MKDKHFINTGEFSRQELEELLQLAKEMKNGTENYRLADKNIGMVFFNPSLRTRTSFEAAINDLGSHSIVLDVGQNVWNLEHRENVVMDQDKPEHVKDAAQVLSGYLDALLVRSFPKLANYEEDMTDPVIESFRKYSTVPVINMESCLYHPCQAMADMMTMLENFPAVDRLKVSLVWSWHVKPLPIAVANSFATICRQFGADLTVAHPPGFELPGMATSEQLPDNALVGSKVNVTNSLDEALHEANVVYVKSWGSLDYYGRWNEEKVVRDKYKDWNIDLAKLDKTDYAILMHCMPFRRNVEISDDAADSDHSVLYEQALNRYYVQKALLYKILHAAADEKKREHKPPFIVPPV